MLETLSLEWFLSHPYVQIWRKQQTNSLIDTVNYINSNWNMSSPINIGRVDRIITQYLTLLTSKARELHYHRIGKVGNSLLMLGDMPLTEPEANYLRIKLN